MAFSNAPDSLPKAKSGVKFRRGDKTDRAQLCGVATGTDMNDMKWMVLNTLRQRARIERRPREKKSGHYGFH